MTTPQQPQSKDWERAIDAKVDFLTGLSGPYHLKIDYPDGYETFVRELRYAFHTLLAEERGRIVREIEGMEKEIPSTFEQPFELAESVGRRMALDDIKALLDPKQEV